MAPRAALFVLAAALAAPGATLAITCPRASTNAHAKCLCTSGCSINGDTVFPWSAAKYPPPSVDLGADTICGTVTLPCNSATSSLTAWLGITGNVQSDNNATCAHAAARARLAGRQRPHSAQRGQRYACISRTQTPARAGRSVCAR